MLIRCETTVMFSNEAIFSISVLETHIHHFGKLRGNKKWYMSCSIEIKKQTTLINKCDSIAATICTIILTQKLWKWEKLSDYVCNVGELSNNKLRGRQNCRWCVEIISNLFVFRTLHSGVADFIFIDSEGNLTSSFYNYKFSVAHKMCAPWLQNPLTTLRLSCLVLNGLGDNFSLGTISHPSYTNNYFRFYLCIK
jgi:hypothetical protein